jgi:hypothetical protein
MCRNRRSISSNPYPVVNDYIGFLDNQAQIAGLRKRFEAYTGPVVNTGGVR